MIVSHQHRFVFAAIPKTGTHSVRQALREHMSADDLEQVGLFVNKRFPFEELAAILDAMVRDGCVEGDYEAALDALLPRHPFATCPTEGLPWVEIDFPQDLEAAETDVLPRLPGPGA